MSVFRLKDYRLGDTIAAIATFPGKSALGVIKVSGPKALAIAAKLFKPRKSKDIRKVKTHTLHYGWIVEKKDKGKSPACRLRPRRDPAESAKGGCMRETRDEVIDEVLLSVMRKPSTYTKEDIVEISSHGGAAVLNKILNLFLQQGARLALPGEFTYRALIGGRIDLLQAESIRGIVDARSEDALTFASSQLRGDTTFKLKRLKQELKELFVLTESMINFPEEEPDSVSCNWEKKIEDLAKRIDGLLKGSREAEIICEGLKCVICGKANAGKSTLFNRLLKEERVIVSRVPGTTRDIIEETISIRGIPLRIYDTAGIIEPEDLVARRALKKSLKIFSECDLVIFVFDGSRPLEKEDLFLLQRVNNKNVIFVINKSDLVQRLNFRKMPQIKGEIVKMSTLKNKGLEKLEDAVFRKVYLQGIDRENVVFLSQYQRQILIRISSSLNRIKAFLDQKQPIDFINIELKECLDNLGRISGEVFSEEILKSIFSNFCIGK